MPRNGSNVYSPPAGSVVTSGTDIESAPYNALIDDLTADLNLARPIVAGGTGATTAAAARTSLGLGIGSDVQAFSANLDAVAASSTSASIAALGTVADRGLYTTGAGVWAEFTQTSQARSLMAAATQSDQRAALGLGTAATANVTDNADLTVDPGNVPTRGNVNAAILAGLGEDRTPINESANRVWNNDGSEVDYPNTADYPISVNIWAYTGSSNPDEIGVYITRNGVKFPAVRHNDRYANFAIEFTILPGDSYAPFTSRSGGTPGTFEIWETK